jgi:hypothetical protein
MPHMNKTLKSQRAAQRAFRPEAVRPSFDQQAAAQQVMTKWEGVESNALHFLCITHLFTKLHHRR